MTPQELEKAKAERVQEHFKQPFRMQANIGVEFRNANAAEYIAAQLGFIARSLERIEQHLTKMEPEQS